jgi:hypothetical protein
MVRKSAVPAANTQNVQPACSRPCAAQTDISPHVCTHGSDPVASAPPPHGFTVPMPLRTHVTQHREKGALARLCHQGLSKAPARLCHRRRFSQPLVPPTGIFPSLRTPRGPRKALISVTSAAHPEAVSKYRPRFRFRYVLHPFAAKYSHWMWH